MIKQPFQHHSCFATKRKCFGKRGAVLKRHYFVTQIGIRATGFYKLGQLGGSELKTQHIHTIHFFHTVAGGSILAHVTFRFFFPAIDIPRNTKTEFQVALFQRILFVMIDQHTRILYTPLGLSVIPFNGVLYRPGDLLFAFLQQNHLILDQVITIGEGEYVLWLVHVRWQRYELKNYPQESGVGGRKSLIANYLQKNFAIIH